jgi:diacylglycerol kinase (ATP)
LNAEQIRF